MISINPNYKQMCLCWVLLKFRLMLENITGAEVNDEVDKKDGIRDAVENDPMCTQVVVKEWYGDRKYDDVGDEQHEHEQIPVKPSHIHIYLLLPSAPSQTHSFVLNNEHDCLAWWLHGLIYTYNILRSGVV